MPSVAPFLRNSLHAVAIMPACHPPASKQTCEPLSSGIFICSPNVLWQKELESSQNKQIGSYSSAASRDMPVAVKATSTSEKQGGIRLNFTI